MGPISFAKYFFSHPLVKRHPIEFAMRFMRWQAVFRFNYGLVPCPWINQSVLLVQRGLHGATFNCYAGLADFQEMSFLLHFLRNDDFFIDVGANVGAYTILAAAVCKARVIAVEPAGQAVAVLSQNIEHNKVQQRVKVFRVCASSSQGTLCFSDSKGPMSHVVHDEKSGGGICVESRRLDDLVGNEIPALIKSDTEGHDLEVLRGAERLLSARGLQAVIVELWKRSKIHNLLSSKGFRSCVYDPFKRELKENTSHLQNNAIYVRDLEYVRKRLVEAPPFLVLSERI